MEWIDSIKEHVPCNEQEKKDKELVMKYINIFDDILKRDNELMHITSSGFVINKNRDKVLMVRHNIFNSWSWIGGHADGEEDLLGVAISEIKEETGVRDIIPITNKIVSLDILPVLGHFKKGQYVSPHLHLSVAYLIQADENEQVTIKPDENSAVRWIPISEIDIHSSESHMRRVYNKIISKIGKLPS